MAKTAEEVAHSVCEDMKAYCESGSWLRLSAGSVDDVVLADPDGTVCLHVRHKLDRRGGWQMGLTTLPRDKLVVLRVRKSVGAFAAFELESLIHPTVPFARHVVAAGSRTADRTLDVMLSAAAPQSPYNDLALWSFANDSTLDVQVLYPPGTLESGLRPLVCCVPAAVLRSKTPVTILHHDTVLTFCGTVVAGEVKLCMSAATPKPVTICMQHAETDVSLLGYSGVRAVRKIVWNRGVAVLQCDPTEAAVTNGECVPKDITEIVVQLQSLCDEQVLCVRVFEGVLKNKTTESSTTSSMKE